MRAADKVRLVEGVPFDVSTRGVTATLRRSDIEEARSGEGPAELLLDITRGQGADVQAHALTVEWSEADLDRLLREAGTADEVTIAFDRDEMAPAIEAEADVEAHGLREKALIFTVVAVSAASTAGVVQARPIGGPGGGAAPATTIGGAVAGPIGDPTGSPATTIGGAGTSTTAAVAPATAESPATTIGGAGPAAFPYVGAPAAESVGASGGGGGSSLPSGEEAALLGAAGLTIAAAGFAAASRRRRPIRPA